MDDPEKQQGEVWSSSVIGVFSILFSPLVGAVLAAINYKRTGNFRKGIYLAAATIGSIIVCDVLAYILVPQHLDLVAFIVDVICIVVVLRDQKIFYEDYEKAHPDKKPRTWPSALWAMILTAIALFVLIVFVSIILTAFNITA